MDYNELRTDNVGRVVSVLLEARGLQRQDLADALGMDASAITRSMKGERKWQVDELIAIATFFDLRDADGRTDITALLRNPQAMFAPTFHWGDAANPSLPAGGGHKGRPGRLEGKKTAARQPTRGKRCFADSRAIRGGNHSRPTTSRARCRARRIPHASAQHAQSAN